MSDQAPRNYFLGLTGSSLQTAQIWTVILPAYVLFGYNNGAMGPLLTLPPWLSTFPALNTLTTVGAAQASASLLQGTVVALYALGAFLGSLSTIGFGDRLGRIRTIQVGAAGTAVGAALQASSTTLGQLIVGRLVAGAGYGVLSATAPNWQSECAPAKHRGKAVLYESVFISAGLAVAGWIEVGASFAVDSRTPDLSWRLPLALPALFALLVLFLAPLFPESPRWLLKHGRVAEARGSLSALTGHAPSHASITASVGAITGSMEATGTLPFGALLSNAAPTRLLHRTLLAVTVQTFQQVCGINALAFFQASVFQTYLGFSPLQARILAAGMFTWQFVCSPLGLLTVDRLGRRRLMLTSATGMAACMAAVAAAASQTSSFAGGDASGGASAAVGGHTKTAAAVAAVFIFLFAAFFPLGFLGMTFLYAAEISPLAARVPVTAVGTATAWVWNFAVAEMTPSAFAQIGWRYYVVWAVINLGVIVPTVYFCFPETAGRRLEEVDWIFERAGGGVWSAVKVAAKMPRGPGDEETVVDSSEAGDDEAGLERKEVLAGVQVRETKEA